MPIPSTVRYFAKQCYQLHLMRGLDTMTVPSRGYLCTMDRPNVCVEEFGEDGELINVWFVPIAKAWASL